MNTKINIFFKFILTFIIILTIGIIPFIIKFITPKFYQNFVNLFLKSTNFKDTVSIYINMMALLFGIAGTIVNILILRFYLKSHNDIMKQTEKINRENNSPLVTLKLLVKEGVLYLKLKNSGNSAAYDISVNFENTIIYDSSPYETLNNLPLFKNLSILDRDEELIFFFDDSISFYSIPENKNLEVKTTISFFNKPAHKRTDENYSEDKYETILSFKELDGILYTKEYSIKDVSNNIEVLAHALILNLEEDKNIEKNLNNISITLENISKNIKKNPIHKHLGRGCKY